MLQVALVDGRRACEIEYFWVRRPVEWPFLVPGRAFGPRQVAQQEELACGGHRSLANGSLSMYSKALFLRAEMGFTHPVLGQKGRHQWLFLACSGLTSGDRSMP